MLSTQYFGYMTASTILYPIDTRGYAKHAIQVPSPNCDARPSASDIILIVIHNISLPAQRYGGSAIIEFFTNKLDFNQHPDYASLVAMKVSAHFLIRRDGQVLQFVSCLARAWHAGVSSWQGRSHCNDFSVGIELEGSDFDCFTDVQYHSLQSLIAGLCQAYPISTVVGHSDIAPQRKTDPGPCFDWNRIR